MVVCDWLSGWTAVIESPRLQTQGGDLISGWLVHHWDLLVPGHDPSSQVGRRGVPIQA